MASKAEDYKALFETFQLDETVAQDLGETIRLAGEPADPVRTLPQLELVEQGDSNASAQLHVGATLGEGGMGVVRQATQMPIGREVALKTVRSSHAGNETIGRTLLREAFVAGRLEHPHIVPIYAVGQDGSGAPVIVMKRIEGATWSEFLSGEKEIPEADSLKWHLEVLQLVCTTVHFAHRHRIIHRDIKPENVMIGELGEVYLVDWGLAVTLEPDPTGRLPYVGDVTQVCGTPYYMAPEMAANEPDRQDERTDVYLLGAVLHEIVTGEPRHRGGGLYEVMLQAYQSTPVDYDDSVPPELATACNRATDREPAGRFQTALELREAIQLFLDHRAAAALADEAADELAELCDVIDRAADDPDERRVAVYRRYGAARFGFERSLEAWPDNEAARGGLRGTLRAMIDWELQHGSEHAAAALLAELAAPEDDLVERVREAERAAAAREAELERLRDFERERDVSIGARARSLFMVAVILASVILPWILIQVGVIDPVSEPLTFWVLCVFLAAAIVVGAAIGWYAGWPAAIERTKLNAGMTWNIVNVCVFLVLSRGVAYFAGIEVSVQVVFEQVVFAIIAANATATLHRGLAGIIPIYLLGALGSWVFDSYALTLYLVSNCAAMAWMVWVWARLDGGPADTPESQ